MQAQQYALELVKQDDGPLLVPAGEGEATWDDRPRGGELWSQPEGSAGGRGRWAECRRERIAEGIAAGSQAKSPADSPVGT
eukprot:305608-Chlamydomonas_euryale.AAC.2